MRTQIYAMLHKWLKFNDEQGIDCILACGVAAMLPGDPLWLFVVDPPGAAKTEICRAFTGPHVYSVDTLTPESLISGFRGKKGKNVDILEDLNGKLLVIKDFTTILQKPERVRDEMFGRLRAAYDGSLAAAYGSGVKRQERVATFGILAAVTPILDNYTKVHTLLGERFVRIRTRYNRHESTERAIVNLGQEPQMRSEIAEIIRIALDYWRLVVKAVALPTPETRARIVALADVTSVLRTGVPRNYRDEVTTMPEPEVGTRLAKQITRLAQGLRVLDCYSYAHLVRICQDTIPQSRMKLLRALAIEPKTTGQLMTLLRMPRHLVLNLTEDFFLLGISERQETQNTFSNTITPSFGETLVKSGLLYDNLI